MGGPARRLKLVVAYDGAGFHGFAAQPNVPTVGGTLSAAIARYAGHDVEMVCAGRTDTGVHAWGQVVHVDVDPKVEPLALRRAVNKIVSPQIAVRQVSVASAGFDARRSAVARRYRYSVLHAEVGSPFLARTVLLHTDPLDLHALELSADPVVGEHDFSSFCRRPPGAGSCEALTRRVRSAGWSVVSHPAGDLYRFEITASSFCHQMVRSLVGTMLDMGRGKKKAGEMSAILRARDRVFASSPAPAHGLCLQEVSYPEGM